MSYTKHEWVNNETITAAKMNNIEDGIEEAAQSGGSSAVIIIDDGTALDKTYAEIYDLVNSGTPCYIKCNVYGSEQDLDTDYAYNVSLMPVVGVVKYDNAYRVYATCSEWNTVDGVGYVGVSGVWTYQVSASNAYPSFLRKTFTKAANVDVFSARI